MELGYTNIDIKSYLAEQEKTRGKLWSLVGSFTTTEWENFAKNSSLTVDTTLGNTVKENTKQILKINGILYQMLQVAVKEDYPESALILSFLKVAGDLVNPSMAMLPLGTDKVAVIFSITRQTLKDNLSPRRKIDT